MNESLVKNGMKTYHCTDLMLNDLFFERGNQAEIARKYDYTAGYISQIKKKFNQIFTKPLVKDGKLKCFLCENTEHLVFHHNHDSGVIIALLCHSCNLKVGDNDLEYKKNPINFPIIKTIKISKEQADNWNLQTPKEIRRFLDGTSELENKIVNLNMIIREMTTKQMEYQQKYNTLIRWLGDSKLGYTKLMVDSELKKLEEMEYW